MEDGTAIEWYAEKDLYAVISNCPHANQALPFPEAKPIQIYISVWETGIEPYSEDHLGMRENPWEELVYERIARMEISPKQARDDQALIMRLSRRRAPLGNKFL